MAEIEGGNTTSTVSESAETPAGSDSTKIPNAPRHLPTRQPIQLDDSMAAVCYANFCRVNGTPEELIVDFGLNTQSAGEASQTLKVTQRVVLNYYTAKRLLAALQVSLQRHEGVFGVLETDVQKRIRPAEGKN